MSACVCFAVRSGFLHLAEALAYHRDTEVPLRAIIAMLKTGERCNAEAELIGKGISMSHIYSNGILLGIYRCRYFRQLSNKIINIIKDNNENT